MSHPRVQSLQDALHYSRVNQNACLIAAGIMAVAACVETYRSHYLSAVWILLWFLFNCYLTLRYCCRVKDIYDVLSRYDDQGRRWLCICPACGHDNVPPSQSYRLAELPEDGDGTVCGNCGRILCMVVHEHVYAVVDPREEDLAKIMDPRSSQGVQLAQLQKMIRLR